MSERATIKDIAQLAQVSLSTVSQVLNGKGMISAETRQRVLAASEQLGYKQSKQARPSNQPNVLTMLVGREISEERVNLFDYHVMQGIEAACRNLDLELRYATFEVDSFGNAKDYPKALEAPDSDGFLVVGGVIRDGHSFFKHVGNKPVLFINSYVYGVPYDYVGIDNRSGGFDATSYLLECGHQHIGFVGGAEDIHPSITERYEGYLQALKAQRVKDSYAAPSSISNSEQVYEVAKTFLETYPFITAVVGATDLVAQGVIRAANERGRSVPEKLSVIGIDNLVAFNQNFSLPLTTMDIDKEYMGALAVRYLSSTPHGVKRPHVSLLVRPSLIVRSSVRKSLRKPAD